MIVEKEQQYLYGAAAFCSSVSEIQSAVTQNTRNPLEEFDESIILRSIAPIYSKDQILSIIIYNANGQPVAYHALDGSYGPVQQDAHVSSQPFSLLIQGQRPYIWEYIGRGSDEIFYQDNSPKICLWYPIKDNWSGFPIGVLAITLDSRKLYPYNGKTDDIANDLYLIDASKQIVFPSSFSSIDFIAENIETLTNTLPQYQSTGYYSNMKLNNGNYNIAYKKIPNTTFYVVYVAEVEQFPWNKGALAFSSVIFLGFSLILGFFILLIIRAFLTKPLNKLISSMEHFRFNETTEPLGFRYHDEIGALGNIFDSIVAENSTLSEKNYLLTIHNQEAELAKLQAQVNPHFIYNTLNTIQWTAIAKGDEEIAELAYSIGQVFRLSLNHGEDFISLFEEFELLNFYLNLQQKRFGDRLSFLVDIDQNLFDVKVPKLLIQPLVENATIHGAKDAYTTIHIQVKVWQSAPGRVHILVSDDGAGISPEVLSMLPDKLPEKGAKNYSTHFALKNIAKRLELYYGNDQLFSIESTLGEGTTINIEFPFK